MENYSLSIMLLGLRDQNLPLFKESRVKRLESIQKMNKLIAQLPRLTPNVPRSLLLLDETDPEWDDMMIYPVVNNIRYMWQTTYWGFTTFMYGYNWNVIHGNRRLRMLAYAYPFISLYFLSSIVYHYNQEAEKVNLFENYCNVRAKELAENNAYMLDHEHYKRFIYFHKDMEETLAMVHRQANNHDSSDFKDSELILQDFIRRHSDESRPDDSLFTQEGRVKTLN